MLVFFKKVGSEMFFWNKKKNIIDKKTDVKSLDSVLENRAETQKDNPEIKTVWDEIIIAYQNQTLKFNDEFKVDFIEDDSSVWRIEYPNNHWGQILVVVDGISLNAGNAKEEKYMTYDIELGDDEFKYVDSTMSNPEFFNDFIEDVIENYLKNNQSKFAVDSAIDSFEIVYKK